MSRILIVDDDEASCRTLQFHLRSQNHSVEITGSVDEGLAVADSYHPDLIILDIRMPGRSGLEGLPDFIKLLP
ncbi:MAG: response regulator, partial [gamma proteobacterium symbiont of Clathrolucina costata]